MFYQTDMGQLGKMMQLFQSLCNTFFANTFAISQLWFDSEKINAANELISEYGNLVSLVEVIEYNSHLQKTGLKKKGDFSSMAQQILSQTKEYQEKTIETFPDFYDLTLKGIGEVKGSCYGYLSGSEGLFMDAPVDVKKPSNYFLNSYVRKQFQNSVDHFSKLMVFKGEYKILVEAKQMGIKEGMPEDNIVLSMISLTESFAGWSEHNVFFGKGMKKSLESLVNVCELYLLTSSGKVIYA